MGTNARASEDKGERRAEVDEERLLEQARALGCEENAKTILETRGIGHAREYVKKVAGGNV